MLHLPPLFVGEPMGRKFRLIAIALALLAACNHSKPKAVVYTLYRNSPTVIGTISG